MALARRRLFFPTFPDLVMFRSLFRILNPASARAKSVLTHGFINKLRAALRHCLIREDWPARIRAAGTSTGSRWRIGFEIYGCVVGHIGVSGLQCSPEVNYVREYRSPRAHR